MKKRLLLISVCLIHFFAFSQQDAWVYFTDKENVSQALENPLSILTQRAIDRKANHGIEIDFRDVPINENYITQIKNAPGITVMAKSKWFNAVHVRGSESDINSLIDLQFVEEVDFADQGLNESRIVYEVVDKFQIEDEQIEFDYGSTQNQVEMLNAHSLHQSDFAGEGVLVAVMDAGFPNVNTMGAFQRLRDAGNLLDGYDFVDRTDDVYAFTGHSHGTRVLSNMAGYIENEYVGTAPDAMYYLFRTEDVYSENPVEESYWVEAAERADSLGVDVINTSLGYKGYDNSNYSYTSEDMDGNTTFITRGANIAFEKGMILISSAGNSGASGIIAPSDSPNVIAVAAVDENEQYASFSSQGSDFQLTQKPNVAARGRLSFVVDQNNNIVQNNGTSFSSPTLAGAVACLRQALPNRTNAEVMQFVHESSSQYQNPDYFLGYGIPDFQLALDIGLAFEASLPDAFIIYPNPVTTELNVRFPLEVDMAELYLFDVLGKLVINTIIEPSVNTLKIDHLSKGVYILRLNGGGESVTFKLIKN